MPKRDLDWGFPAVASNEQWGIALLFVWILGLFLLSGCRTESPLPPASTNTEVLPTDTIRLTPTPRQLQQPTATFTPVPTETARIRPETTPLPDFSGVQLYWLTYFDDPRYFQVILEDWPDAAPEDLIVRVETFIYTCDKLYPDRYPTRMYCWGDAPPEGANVVLQVIAERVAEPLVEIPFTVPYIPRESPTPTPKN